jgi:hypothetical protein
MSMEDLEVLSARAQVRHLAAKLELEVRESGQGTGFQAVLVAPSDRECVFFAVAPRGGGYLSLSLVLVVDEAFFREHIEEILGVTARYDACVSLARSEDLAEGEVYLNLSQRIFLAGLSAVTLGQSIENLRAVREALGGEFP